MSKRSNNTGKFQLDEAELTAAMARYDAGSFDEAIDPLEPDLFSTDADSIHTLISEAIWNGVVTCPGEREIFIYPSSVEETHVCLITVWDGIPEGKSHVVAATLELKDLAPREMWEGEDRYGITKSVLEQILALANSVHEEMDAVTAVVQKRASRNK